MITESITAFITFFTSRGIPLEAVLLILFIAFLWIIKKLFNIFFGALKVVIASALFPVLLNKVLKMAVPLTVQTFLYYVNAGLVLYIIYLLLRSSLSIGKFIAAIFGRKK